ncbi:hypothetical protein KC342_g37 [Hortaea werneckii]|nr:hypothetical protein KC342_g37 [Hortaea werneckii]
MAYTTYHCLCSELIVALPKQLEQFPRREGDASYVCGGRPTTVNASVAEDATIMKLEDGFEKRLLRACKVMLMWRVRRKPAWLRSEMGNVAFSAQNAKYLSECCVVCRETDLLRAEAKSYG